MLHLGTSSWTNLGNHGEFYPERITGPREKLQYYSKYFSTVEIESSRYAFLEQKNIKSWIYRTPSNFIFNMRAHGALTAHAVSPKNLPEKISSMLNLKPEDRKKDYIYVNDRRVIEAIAVEFVKTIELLKKTKETRPYCLSISVMVLSQSAEYRSYKNMQGNHEGFTARR